MARNSRGTPLSWGIVFLAICGIWLVLMLSNRRMALPLFFLGGQTLTLPVGLWLFGAFVLGNGVSFGILSFLQWTIASLAQDSGRSDQRFAGVPRTGRAAPEMEWEGETEDEDEFDWEESPVPQKPVQSPASPAPSAQAREASQPDRSPESAEDQEELESVAENPPPSAQGKVYEAPPPPRQGTQEGSSYSYQYRPARRAQGSGDRSPSRQPSRPSPPGGVPQKVVDVNYRVINPGSVTPAPSPRFSGDNKGNDRRGDNRGWDDSDQAEDW
jgi:hypothetical protein